MLHCQWNRRPGLSAGHAVVEGIFAARRQSARDFAHNLNDLPHDITAVAAGGPFEQIPNRSADLCLCVVGVGEFPIVLIFHDSTPRLRTPLYARAFTAQFSSAGRAATCLQTPCRHATSSGNSDFVVSD